MKIFSIAFNRPEFVRLQAMTFRRFFPDAAELVIVNNARESSMKTTIAKVAEDEDVACVNPGLAYPGLAGLSHQAAMRWIVNLIRDTSGIAIIVDHDIFPYKDFDPFAYLSDRGAMMAGVAQARGHVVYPWPGCLIMDMYRLPDHDEINLDGYHVEGEHVDSGGQLYPYIERHRIPWRHMPTTSQIRQASQGKMLPPELRESYDFGHGFEFIADSFMHYGRGSNWDSASNDAMKRKTDDCRCFLEKRCRG